MGIAHSLQWLRFKRTLTLPVSDFDLKGRFPLVHLAAGAGMGTGKRTRISVSTNLVRTGKKKTSFNNRIFIWPLIKKYLADINTCKTCH